MNICSVPPILLEDMNVHMMQWGKEGTMDPFKEIYRVRPRNGAILNRNQQTFELSSSFSK
jgi:hypothetical protein